jgi:hypothetical protein
VTDSLVKLIAELQDHTLEVPRRRSLLLYLAGKFIDLRQ